MPGPWHNKSRGWVAFFFPPILYFFFIFCFAALGSNLGIFPCSVCPLPPSHLPVNVSPAQDRVLASARQPEVFQGLFLNP